MKCFSFLFLVGVLSSCSSPSPCDDVRFCIVTVTPLGDYVECDSKESFDKLFRKKEHDPMIDPPREKPPLGEDV